MSGASASPAGGPALITGGAGFVGTNLADRLLRDGERVRVLDSLARPGAEDNLRWLTRTHPGRVEVSIGDVRDARAVDAAVRGASAVFHLAAQVAVTTSLADPVEDFEVNARGTLNVLEALRRSGFGAPVVFTSTNKVYGALEDLALELTGGRWQPRSGGVRARGIGEDRPVAFHSPYGCSKGAADQYVLDYARTFGASAVVFRMSCIYGPHQHGNEDQGWVAHFLKAAMAGEAITLYGDGRQVRDVLYVDDLVEAFLLARRHAARLAGQAFNVGGGPGRTVSLLELLDTIEELEGDRPEVRHAEWRAADQRYYVSDTRRFESATGWRPTVGAAEGVRRLHAWLRASSRAEAAAAPAGAAEVHP